MKEKTLLKISIICALAGVFLLYVVSESIELNEISIGGIKEEENGKDVKVRGIVKDAFNGEKLTIITITHPEDTKIILYKNVSFSEGDYIEVIGEIDQYNGKKEVIGNRVRKLG